MTIRIMINPEDSYRLDEYANALYGRKLSETTHRQNNTIEKAFAFHNLQNKNTFLAKVPLLFESVKLVAET